MYFEDAIITHLFWEVEYSQHGINPNWDRYHLVGAKLLCGMLMHMFSSTDLRPIPMVSLPAVQRYGLSRKPACLTNCSLMRTNSVASIVFPCEQYWILYPMQGSHKPLLTKSRMNMDATEIEVDR